MWVSENQCSPMLRGGKGGIKDIYPKSKNKTQISKKISVLLNRSFWSNILTERMLSCVKELNFSYSNYEWTLFAGKQFYVLSSSSISDRLATETWVYIMFIFCNNKRINKHCLLNIFRSKVRNVFVTKKTIYSIEML